MASDGPLTGIRVLDLTRVLSGPHCTRMLADFGADVVKLEPPDGDITRFFGKRIASLSGYFTQQNAGKRDISVALDTDEGRALARRLADRADVIVSNFRPGVMERFGLGWDDLSPSRPELIWAAISGYGDDNELSDRRAYANAIHARAGLLERHGRVNGHETPPLQFAAGDTYSSLELLAGILAALFHRERTGHGQRIEVAMFDTILAIDDQAVVGMWDPDDRTRDSPPLHPTTDGSVFVAGDPTAVFGEFVEASGRTELLDDPRFATLEARRTNKADIIAEMDRWTSTLSSAEVEERLEAAGLASAPAWTTLQAVDWARANRPGVVVELDDRDGGTVEAINSPQRFSGTPTGIAGVAPWRGEHNADVLRDWLDIRNGEIDRLADTGVISDRPPKRRTASGS